MVAEALFREIDRARAETPGVEFVVTLQVLADVIVAPRGAETSKPGGANGTAKTREVLRDALAEGFDDMHATRDSDALTASFRGGRGAGAASAAAAYFRTDASRPVIPRVREDPDAKLFFAEGAIEAAYRRARGEFADAEDMVAEEVEARRALRPPAANTTSVSRAEATARLHKGVPVSPGVASSNAFAMADALPPKTLALIAIGASSSSSFR